ncbi:hypothetical protein AB7M39_002412 [Bradyrhizobium diazoefficiens]|jgi:hypothetical protein
MHDQPDIGLAGATNAIDMVLEVAQNEDDAVGIGEVIDDALSRRCFRRRCRFAHGKSTK